MLGARHLAEGPTLGSSRDVEDNGLPTAGATGDDTNNTDDEDGVTFTSMLVPGETATVTVVSTGHGYLSAWIDFDQNTQFITYTNGVVIIDLAPQ